MPQIRANVTIAVNPVGSEEPDVFLQGEERWDSPEHIQRIIIEHIRMMEPGDWIAFLVVPSTIAVPHTRDMAVPMAYQGEVPSASVMLALGFHPELVVECYGNCESRSDHGEHCTMPKGHLEGADGGVNHVSVNGDIW